MREGIIAFSFLFLQCKKFVTNNEVKLDKLVSGGKTYEK